MNDYISRDALLEKIDGIWDCNDMVFEPDDHCCGTDDCGSCKWWQTKNAIRKIAAAIPAADVRPVVKGEWEPAGGSVFPMYACSKCRAISLGGNFCPNCGADMREVKADG